MNKTAAAGFAALFCLLFISIYFYGIRWGIPSKERVKYVLNGNYAADKFYDIMSESRQEIYSVSGRSPLGRLNTGGQEKISPVSKISGADKHGKIFYRGEINILSNFIRPYLLRTNHTDEQMSLNALSVMEPARLDFNPRMFQYGGAYIYGLGAYLGFLHIVKAVKITPDLKYYLKNPDEMGGIFVAGRALNIFFYFASVLAVYFIIKNLYGSNMGFISSFIFAFCPAVYFQTHIMKPYIQSLFFLILSVMFALEINKNRYSARNNILCGIFSGLTIGTMPAYFVFLFFNMILIMDLKSGKKSNILFTVACAAFIMFAITNPYALLHFNEFIAEFSGTGGIYFNNADIIAAIKFFLLQIPLGVSTPVFALFTVSFISSFFLADRFLKITSIYTMIVLLLWSFVLKTQPFSIHNSRFLLPGFFLMIICVSGFFHRFKLIKTPIKQYLLYAALLIAALNCSVIAKNLYLDGTMNSTRLIAAEWIENNVPFGATIGLDYMPEPAHCPPLDFTKYKINIYLEKPDNVPDYFIIVGGASRFQEFLTKNGYAVAGNFLPAESMFGVGYHMGSTHINSPVYIYGKEKNVRNIRQD
ncbi:MAG: hypothetical protein BWY26_00989 [Elusimicrobia bacterium ADurb.Bin231]|nr:MAG: hypothetical protein BWY26_00989 [Elusimicrobia bacterium ADurb.Bin231]